MAKLLLTTKEAAQYTGLSQYELRRGYKMGLYPAIEIGAGERSQRLRWHREALERAIVERMERKHDAG